jgi:hypothetical protein
MSQASFNHLVDSRRTLRGLQERWQRERDTPARWEIIRKAYATGIDKSVRRLGPYILDWDFTPIERDAWFDIRSMAIPLCPQFPVGRCFLDFGDPTLKIGVEMDGAQYHEEQRDRLRDELMWSQGWRVFRVAGRKARPTATTPLLNQFDLKANGSFERELVDWGLRWSEGFFWALNNFYYKPTTKADRSCARVILDSHHYIDFSLEIEQPRVGEISR